MFYIITKKLWFYQNSLQTLSKEILSSTFDWISMKSKAFGVNRVEPGIFKGFLFYVMAIQKLYYTIGEVAKECGVTPNAIRQWTKKVPEMSPKRRDRLGRVMYVEEEKNLVKKVALIISKGLAPRGVSAAFDGGYFDKIYKAMID